MKSRARIWPPGLEFETPALRNNKGTFDKSASSNQNVGFRSFKIVINRCNIDKIYKGQRRLALWKAYHSGLSITNVTAGKGKVEQGTIQTTQPNEGDTAGKKGSSKLTNATIWIQLLSICSIFQSDILWGFIVFSRSLSCTWNQASFKDLMQKKGKTEREKNKKWNGK